MCRITLLALFSTALMSGFTAAGFCYDREAKTLDIVYNDGRAAERISLYAIEQESEELYISALDLARIFKATRFWNPSNRKLVLRVGAHRYLFTVDTRVVVIDEAPMLLHVPARYSDGTVMIPFEFVTKMLAPRCTLEIEYNEKRSILSIGVPDYNVASLDISDDRTGTRAVLALTEELHYHIDREKSGILRLKIYGGRLDPSQFSVSSRKGLINRVRAEQTGGDAFLLFELDKKMSRYRVEFESIPGKEGSSPGRRLVLFFERGESGEKAPGERAGGERVESPGAHTPGAGTSRTIVIDPGHGGSDAGRIGRSGRLEKDVNLAIALSLRDRLIQQPGIRVVMTRTDDRDVSLDERIEIANTAGGEIYVGIHTNGWDSEKAHGFEVLFFSGRETSDRAGATGKPGSSSSRETGSREEVFESEFVPWNLVQVPYVPRSSELAEKIQRELARNLETRNRGVRQARLYVLRSLSMPAVQVEIGFISNPKEDRLLRSPDYCDRLVEAIAEAILSFGSSSGEAQ